VTARALQHAPAPVAGAFITVLLALVLAACGDAAPAGERVPGVRAGVTLPAPEDLPAAPVTESVQVLGAQDGTELSLADYAGEVVVLNFWASWCGPCRAEQPELNAAATAMADLPVAFLGVNIDDTVPNAQAHEREFEIPYPSVFDPAAAYASEFGGVGPRSIPTTILIDAEGRVAARLFGITDLIEVTALAERLAEEAPPES
jgi:thiol-disulfide isomerase/thioredoxin